MGIKKQFAKIKENWLIIVLAIVLFLFMSGGSGFLSSVITNSGLDKLGFLGGNEMMSLENSIREGYYPGSVSSDFAPGVEERKND